MPLEPRVLHPSRSNVLPVGAFFGETLREARTDDLILTEVRTPARQVTTVHAHQRAYFELVLEGRWLETCGSLERSLAPWMIIYHPPGERHHNRFPDTPGRSLHVELSDAWVARLRAAEFAVERPLDSRAREVVTPMLRLVRELRRADRWSPLSIEGSVLEAASLLGRDDDRRRDDRLPGWLTRFERMLREEYATTFSLRSMAERLGVSPFALTRTFRRRHGCVPSEFVRRLRVERVAAELTATERPLSAIAAANGFADQSHMTRVFRRYTGVTPAAFRHRRTGRPETGH